MEELVELEWEAHCELEHLGVLVDIDFKRLFSQGLLVHAHCADQKDLGLFLMGKQLEFGLPHQPEDMFMPTRLGGILKLTQRSPFIKPGRSTAIDFCEEIEDALEYSDRTRVTGGTHWPCKEVRKRAVSVGYARCIHFAGVNFFNRRNRERGWEMLPVHHIHQLHDPQKRQMRLKFVRFEAWVEFMKWPVRGVLTGAHELLFRDRTDYQRGLELITSATCQ